MKYNPRPSMWALALTATALLALVPCGTGAATTLPQKPNVIFILTDDQGWGDAKFNGHPYVKTPSLDRLASQGTWFKQFYVGSTVCSPSRCAFLTSHFPARHLFHTALLSPAQNQARFLPSWLDTNVVTVAKCLKQAGYTTGHFGKWHLGSGPGAPEPSAYGFDTYKTASGNGPVLGEDAADEGGGQGKGKTQADPFFRAKSTALIVDETIQFLQANRNRPFYVDVWTLLPHAPLHPTPEQLKVYENLAARSDDPAFGPWMQKYLATSKNLNSQMQVFCASLTDLDTQIGRLLKAVEDLKLADNTIIFFSSDNGPEEQRLKEAANAGVGNPGPLRARKRSMYEGGIRTFGVVRWPGHVPAGRVDETSVVSGVDWLPTICKLAGAPVPADWKLDGEDVSDIWLGRSRPRARPLMWEWLIEVIGAPEYQPPPLAIRKDNWKLFCDMKGGKVELYDIPNDPSELRNVAATHPDIAKLLTAEALAWQQTLPPSPLRELAAKGVKTPTPAQPSGKGNKKRANAP